MSTDSLVWDGSRPVADRTVLDTRQIHGGDTSLVLATEDIRRPTDWCLQEPHHTIVVHLAGHLQRMESVFSNGPSCATIPSIGDIWVIPAGVRYAALAQGNTAQFAEFRLPVDLLGGGHLEARVAHRDPFLHQASVRAQALAARRDDLGAMALQALLAMLRLHFADVYMGGLRGLCGGREPVPWRFSLRQKQLLVDHIAAGLQQAMAVRDLAAVAGVPETRLISAFKASFGTTPWQYVLRARLAAARALLETSRASITSIAATTGFSSPSHLATSFRKHHGRSPSDHRRHAPEDGQPSAGTASRTW